MRNTAKNVSSIPFIFIILIASFSSRNSFGLSSDDSKQEALDVISKNWFPLTGQEE